MTGSVPDTGPIKLNLHPPTSCCNYTCTTNIPYPVMWNPYNKVVQCHNCGVIFTSMDASVNGFQEGIRWAVSKVREQQMAHYDSMEGSDWKEFITEEFFMTVMGRTADWIEEDSKKL